MLNAKFRFIAPLLLSFRSEATKNPHLTVGRGLAPAELRSPFDRYTLYGVVTAGRCRLGLTFLSLNKKVSKEVSLRESFMSKLPLDQAALP